MPSAVQKASLASLSSVSLERLIETLPAGARAQVKWAPAALTAELRAFLQGTQTEPEVEGLVAALARFFEKLDPVLNVQLIESPGPFLAAFEDSWRTDLASLCSQVTAIDRELATWAVRAWGACIRHGLLEMSHADPADVRQFASSFDARTAAGRGSPLRVQALLMAAIEAVRQRADQKLISGIISGAFDDANALIASLAAVGVFLDPFEGEAPVERGERLRSYVEHLREQIDDADLRALDEARLRRLR